MKKLARAIVKMRRLILIAAVLLLIPAAVGAIATPINYDILSYLPQELDSRVGQLLLETDYHLASTNMITVEGMPTNELLDIRRQHLRRHCRVQHVAEPEGIQHVRHLVDLGLHGQQLVGGRPPT